MKKIIKSLMIVLLGLLMSVNVMADVQQEKQEPEYTTDYYMIVESRAGGIDIYALPDQDSSKLNDSQIPNGTALHIEGETEDKENNRTWGYTEYHGMHGYVPLDDCRPAQSRKEAIDSELYIAGRDNVDYNADYTVKAYSEDGSQKLYQGPGTKYGEVPGVRDIQNGETLHITEDAELVDGSHWGVTTIDDKEGWVNLETPAPTATSAPTATPESTETPAPTETQIPTETPEPQTTEHADKDNADKDNADNVQTSGKTVITAESSKGLKPLICIVGIAVLAAIGVLIYHYKKR